MVYCFIQIQSIQFLPRLITFSAQCYFRDGYVCALFVIRWRVTQIIPYWRWNSIVLHIACCFALGGRVVLEAEGPGLVVAGEILGFTGVWFCYGILRFVVFLYKAFFARSFTLAWLSFQIQRLIGKKGDL